LYKKVPATHTFNPFIYAFAMHANLVETMSTVNKWGEMMDSLIMIQ